MTKRAVVILLTLFLTNSLRATDPVVDKVHWSSFMAHHDMLWDSLPDNWFNAPFLGNGEQGTLMYKLDEQTLRWDVGCSAAHDHRPVEKDDYSDKNPTVLNCGRHFIGHLQLKLPEDVTMAQSRLSLWDAEATGTLNTKGGTLDWATLVHATEPVMRFELLAQGTLKGAKLVYVAEEARNPRAVRALTLKKPVDEKRVPANPSPVLATLNDGVHTAVHNLHAGGQTAVAWIQKTVGGKTLLWLSVKHSFPNKDAVNQAVAAVRNAARADQSEWVQEHRTWWHDYYPQSFISTGDSYWDSFYWIQQYKLACATRDKGWIIDNQGPWLQLTAWPALWWNLNVQLSHSGGYTANRRSMVSAMSHRLDINRDNLAQNVAEPYRTDSYALGRSTSGWDLLGDAGQPGGREPLDAKIGRETGNLLWGIHNIDLEYRYWQDTDLRDNVLYPLLTRAVNYYRHFLVENEDGQLSLPETFSPEYRIAADCTYDIDLLGWGVGRLLELAKEMKLSQKDEPLIPVWKEIQAKLVPVHIDEESGRMIGRDVELTGRHRHWSHLMAIYPLRTLTPESSADRELIDRSLTHWHSFGRAMGYSFTGGSCMASLLGDGERAFGFLNGLKSFLQPNTCYYEIDHLPVMETPLHGATAMQEMLLQSWGGKLRIFPAVPTEWPDAQFHQLRGEGGFLVSARREQGKTKWVLVKAEAGGTVEVQTQLGNAKWINSKGVKVRNEQGVYTIKTAPGDWVLFWPADQAQPETSVTPVDRRGEEYRFGLTN
ncbi:glycosyl hydrolase family 95 catalytic domain-containing protein [Saccharicrinis sp. GN24d3]|uniref:glycosyl hydrolase family 95 catalytic domain-containing protein n=1 Tax=Saccharicrinis sp. GN24d3 TaxID=3458416 RepID=UPI004037484C